MRGQQQHERGGLCAHRADPARADARGAVEIAAGGGEGAGGVPRYEGALVISAS